MTTDKIALDTVSGHLLVTRREGLFLSIKVIFPVSRDSGTTPSVKILFTKSVSRFITADQHCEA